MSDHDMAISAPGLVELASHEGIVLGPYKDSVGVWTYGVGSTKNASGQDPKTMPMVDTRGWNSQQVRNELRRIFQRFDSDLDLYEKRVNDAIEVPLEQHEYDALVSFDFNTGGIHRAKLTKAINRGDKSGKGFMGWLRPPEIIGRRKKEMALFQTGHYDVRAMTPIYDALGDGRFERRGSLDAATLLELMLETNGDKPTPPQPNEGFDLIAWIIGLIRQFLKRKD